LKQSIFAPACERVKICHAGRDPASSAGPDSRLRGTVFGMGVAGAILETGCLGLTLKKEALDGQDDQ
jgi:hypothetical protein